MDPVSCPVTGGHNSWLGPRPTEPAWLDGTESELGQRQDNSQRLGSGHVVGGTAGKYGRGPLQLGGGYTNQGQAGNDHSTLAQEVTTWLGSRNPVINTPNGNGPGPLPETGGPTTTPVGIAIEERDLTPENFWSLLRDAGYKVW